MIREEVEWQKYKMGKISVKSNNQLLRVIDKELHKWVEIIYTLVFRCRCQNLKVPINRTVLAVSTDSMVFSVSSKGDVHQCSSCKVNMLFKTAKILTTLNNYGHHLLFTWYEDRLKKSELNVNSSAFIMKLNFKFRRGDYIYIFILKTKWDVSNFLLLGKHYFYLWIKEDFLMEVEREKLSSSLRNDLLLSDFFFKAYFSLMRKVRQIEQKFKYKN